MNWLERYEYYDYHHALSILKHDFPEEWADISEVLSSFILCRSFIETGGGGKSKVSDSIDKQLYGRGWSERKFETAIVVDKSKRDSPTHKVDCFKNRVAFEIEWNNKDPFFDRDLNNFRLLHQLDVVSVGLILTRADGLQALFDRLGIGKKYGSSTTHMSKLLPKVRGGGGGACPILILGITEKLYDNNC
jgi:hypothetical protein